MGGMLAGRERRERERECYFDDRPFIHPEPSIYDPKYSYDSDTGEMSALGLVRYKSDLQKHDDRDVLYKTFSLTQH